MVCISRLSPETIPTSGLPAELMLLGSIPVKSHVSARRLESYYGHHWAIMYMRGEDRTPFDASPNLGTPKTRVRVRLAGGVNVGSGV